MSAVVQAFRVLEQLARSQPVGVSELSRIMGLPKTTTHRILRDLEQAGWATQRSEPYKPAWVLTAAPAVLSQYVAGDLNLQEAALPVMESLREHWRESVHLAVPRGHETVIVQQLESLHEIRIHWPVGQHYSTHATANGKALLAFSKDSQFERLYPAEFTRYTDQTITSEAEFLQQLEVIRATGYAVALGELREDIASVAAPILSLGAPVASISVFMPVYRFTDGMRAEIGASVAAGAEQIGNRLRS